MSAAFQLKLPQKFRISQQGEWDREDFLGALWEWIPDLRGIDEGTMLSDEAHALGFETEAFPLDIAQAPHSRDWVGKMEEAEVTLFFDSLDDARRCHQFVQKEFGLLGSTPEDVPEQDWDAEWKRSFQGMDLSPHFVIRPPWRKPVEGERTGMDSGTLVVIQPGAGFGTGTHETTRLCLELLGEWMSRRARQPLEGSLRGLDFGSGSGILLTSAWKKWSEMTKKSSKWVGVEIDALAHANFKENLRWNDVPESDVELRFSLEPKDREFDLVLANILRPTLIEFAPQILMSLREGGDLILSGLVETDVHLILTVYQPSFEEVVVRSLDEWRGLYFRSKKALQRP